MNVAILNTIYQDRDTFFKFIDKCSREYQLLEPSTYLYQKLMEKYRNTQDFKSLYTDREYLELVYITLKSWNMNQRGAKMVPYELFKKSVNENIQILLELYSFKLNEIKKEEFNNILVKIEILFKNINVMHSASKIVGVSKALHFLLPDLVIPVDRKYSMHTIYGHDMYFNDINKEWSVYSEIFNFFYRVSIDLKLTEKDINKQNYNLSIPKLIDNALIGYVNSKN